MRRREEWCSPWRDVCGVRAAGEIVKIFDVAVVGTGPAGTAAALMLAQGGADVVMLEKATLPRYKTCGGGVLHRAMQLLGNDLGIAVERNCLTAELNFVDSGLHFATTRSDPLIAMTMRADLDAMLCARATAAGATLQQACEVIGVNQLADRVQLQTSTGDIHARFVVAADGAHSPVATAAGWRETRTLIPALEYEMEVCADDFARLSQTARFDFGTIAAGYAWVFPKRSHLSVGVLSMRRGPVHLKEALAGYLDHLAIGEPITVTRHGYVIPVTPRTEPLARNRVFLTGDAAGLVDPVTAEGITHAILSGQLAARSLLDCRFDAGSVAGAYQRIIEDGILKELRAARWLARLLYEHPRLCRWLFRRHGQVLSEFVADVVMGKQTYRGALHSPAASFPRSSTRY